MLGFALWPRGASRPGPAQLHGINSFGEGTGSIPSYSAGHRYEQDVTPVSDAELFVETWPGYAPGDGVARTGGFTVEVFREAPDGGPVSVRRSVHLVAPGLQLSPGHFAVGTTIRLLATAIPAIPRGALIQIFDRPQHEPGTPKSGLLIRSCHKLLPTRE